MQSLSKQKATRQSGASPDSMNQRINTSMNASMNDNAVM